MFRFNKGKVETYTKILNVLGLHMELTLDLPNSSNIPNTMNLEILYNSLLIIRLNSFLKR